MAISNQVSFPKSAIPGKHPELSISFSIVTGNAKGAKSGAVNIVYFLFLMFCYCWSTQVIETCQSLIVQRNKCSLRKHKLETAAHVHFYV